MESKYGEDGKCVGCEMWDCAGWEPWVWEQGKARVRARDAPTRGTVTWVPPRATATEYSHRVLCQRIPSQGIDTGYCHRVQSQDTATNLCHG